MFRFNFNNDDNGDDTKQVPSDKSDAQEEETKKSEEIVIDDEKFKEISQTLKTSSERLNTFISNDVEIGYLDVALFTDSESDLVPNVYEGGFKIWECTQDMMDLITASKELSSSINAKNVCDLGCSAGLIGILCLSYGAKMVHFQDYNEDVLEKFTIPNVINYLGENDKSEDFTKCKFFSGDWTSFQGLNVDDKYDFIVTAETIYNAQNYDKLLNLFKAKLSQTGVVYLSAKSYYFGLSGNVLDFCKQLNSDNTFHHEVVWKSVDGLQREILQIQHKK